MKYLVMFVLFLGFLPLEAREQGSSSRPSRSARSSSHSVSRPARQISPRVRSQRAPRVIVQRSPRYRSSYRSYGYRSYGYSSYGGGYYGGSSYQLQSSGAGIRFNMDLIKKEDRKMVERGIVSVDGAEQGIVDRFDSWQNGHVPVTPGEHKVVVEVEDGRVFETPVLAQPGQIVRVYIRFPVPKLESEKQ